MNNLKFDNIKAKLIINRKNENSTSIINKNDFFTENVDISNSENKIMNFYPMYIDWGSKVITLSGTENKFNFNSYPFFYQWQRKFCNLIIDIPFSKIEENLILKTAPIFIFSIGRCGSTLLVKLCGNLGVKVVSETDSLTNLFEGLKHELTINDILKIIKFNVGFFSDKKDEKVVFKLRGTAFDDIDLFIRAFPNAKYIFIFREPIAWAKSNIKAFGDDPSILVEYLKNSIKTYDLISNRNLNFITIWYEDLILDPISILREVIGDESVLDNFENIEKIQKTLDLDSQNGTSISRDNLKKIKINDNSIYKFIELWKENCPYDLIEKHSLNNFILL